MRAWITSLALSITCLCSMAQIPSVHESSPFRADRVITPTGTARSEMPQWHEIIQNQGSSSMVAFHALFRCAGEGNPRFVVVDHDALLIRTDSQIPPSGRLEVNAADSSRCSGGIDSAIFADGHSEGTEDAVRRLYAIRKGYSDALGEVDQLLEDIANGRDTPENVALQLGEKSRTLSNGTVRMDPHEALGMRSVIDLLRNGLSARTVVFAPSTSPKGLGPSIEVGVKNSHVTDAPALATIIRSQFQVWKQTLNGNVDPPVAHP